MSYDFFTDDSTGMRPVPQGAKQAAVEMIGGYTELASGKFSNFAPTAIKVVGFNLWDGLFERGYLPSYGGTIA